MFDLTAAQQAALARRSVKRRLFITVTAKDPDTGDPSIGRFWDDVGNVDLDGDTYYGSGNVVSVSSISARGDLTIPGLNVTLSGIATETTAMIRGDTVGQAPISVDIGIYDLDTQQVLAPLVPFFRGYVDDIRIETPAAGDTSTIVLICESTSRSLTIKRTETRSDASAKALFPTDRCYEYTGLAADTPVYFGKAAP